MTKTTHSPNSDTATITKEKVTKPRMRKVLLHNDDYTTMDFVVEILVHIFHKSEREAVVIMKKIHIEGLGVCGIYPSDVAETKVNKVHSLASEAGFPLLCTAEPE